MSNPDKIVTRPNETIGIVPNGKQRITHLVRRLYSVMLLFSQQQGEQEEYAALLNDMLAAANSSGSNRTQVKAILRDIRAIGVDWNVRDGEREVWKNVGLIEEPGLIDGRGTPTVVTWKLPKIIRARLLDPRGFFTRISLEMMTRLRSGASIALYEICCQYASNDHRGEGGLTNRAGIDDWMPRLTGSKKVGYEYKFFKRDVIQNAMEEINEITDLRVELVEHKDGRKVSALQFRVFRKPAFAVAPAVPPLSIAQSLPVLAKPPKAQRVKAVPPVPHPVQGIGMPVDKNPASPLTGEIKRVMAIGATQATAERICRRFEDDPAFLQRHLAYVEARIAQTSGAPLVNKIAFLQKALDHRYADSPAVIVAPTMAPVSPANGFRYGAATRPDPAEVGQRELEQSRRSEVWARFQAITDDQGKSAAVARFLSETSATVKTFYRRNGLHNMIVQAALIDWLLQKPRFDDSAG